MNIYNNYSLHTFCVNISVRKIVNNSKWGKYVFFYRFYYFIFFICSSCYLHPAFFLRKQPTLFFLFFRLVTNSEEMEEIYNEVSLLWHWLSSITRGGKKSISSQSFLLSIKVLNWRYTNKKIKKGDQKKLHTNFDTTRWRTSQWIWLDHVSNKTKKKIFHKDTTEIWESNDN